MPDPDRLIATGQTLARTVRYSRAEIAEFAPLAACGNVRVPTLVAVVPPEPSANSCNVIGEA